MSGTSGESGESGESVAYIVRADKRKILTAIIFLSSYYLADNDAEAGVEVLKSDPSPGTSSVVADHQQILVKIFIWLWPYERLVDSSQKKNKSDFAPQQF